MSPLCPRTLPGPPAPTVRTVCSSVGEEQAWRLRALPPWPRPTPLHLPLLWSRFPCLPSLPDHVACRSRANHTGSRHKTTDFNGNHEGGGRAEGVGQGGIAHAVPCSQARAVPDAVPSPHFSALLAGGQDILGPLVQHTCSEPSDDVGWGVSRAGVWVGRQG